MKFFLAAIFIVFASLTASAQDVAFRLGMTREDVTRDFGRPARWFANGQYYDHVPSSVGGGTLWDVYSRRTAQNEYEVLVNFRVDASESRLHPTLRVHEVRFRADKAKTMKEMLLDLPEAITICASGCRAHADKIWGLTMYLVPVADASVATLTGTLSDPDTGQRIPPGAKLTVDQISISESSRKDYQAILNTTTDTGAVWKP